MLELLVAMSVLLILMAIAVPSFSGMHGQIKASEDIRGLAQQLASLRSEAVRLKNSVRVSFNPSGYTWDLADDGSQDGYVVLGSRSVWSGSIPSDIVFNGLGLARGISSSATLTIQNGSSQSSLVINSNGHISL